MRRRDDEGGGDLARARAARRTVRAEGDLDFRGTLAVDKEAPVGFRAIRLAFEVETDATPEQLATLEKLTERYCVVWQSLRTPPEGTVTITAA